MMEHIGGTLKLLKEEGLENEINQRKAIDLWEMVKGEKISCEPVKIQVWVL